MHVDGAMMTFSEKQKIASDITKLAGKDIMDVIKIVKGSMPGLGENGDVELDVVDVELDVEKMDDTTLWKLSDFLKNKQKAKPKSKPKSKKAPKRPSVDTAPCTAWAQNRDGVDLVTHFIPFNGSKVDHDICERPTIIRKSMLLGLQQTQILRPVENIDPQELDHFHKLPPWIFGSVAAPKDADTIEFGETIPLLQPQFGVYSFHDLASILFLARQASETSDIYVHFNSQKPRQPFWTRRFGRNGHKGMIMVHNEMGFCVPDALGTQIEAMVRRFPTPRHLSMLNTIVSREIMMHPNIGFQSDDFRNAKLVFDYGQTWMSVDGALRNTRDSYCISVTLEVGNDDVDGSIQVYMKRKPYETWIARNALEFFLLRPYERDCYLPGGWHYPEVVTNHMKSHDPHTWALMKWKNAIACVIQDNRRKAKYRRKLFIHEQLETLKHKKESEERRKIRAAAEAKKESAQEKEATPPTPRSKTSTLHKSTDIVRGESAVAKAVGQRADATEHHKMAIRMHLKAKAERKAEEEEQRAVRKHHRDIGFAIVNGD